MNLPKSIVNAVVNKAREEYDFSFQSVQRKRDYFRQNYPLLLNIGKEHKIYERLIFRMVDMMCAISHKFRPNVTFQGRSEDDLEYIKYLELVKDFDYDEMGMATKNYWVHWYKFVFGSGIQVRDTFDKFSSTPQYKVMNPMSWIPDIAFDVNGGFRFHGFEIECTIEELEYARDFYNLGSLKDMKTLQKARTEEQQQTYLSQIQTRKLNGNINELPEGVFSVYQHFTTYQGNKYEVRLGNDRTMDIMCRWIKPVLEEEKKNPSKVGYGVNVRRFRPLPNDPFGLSFAFDLLADKQKQLQVLHNLNLIKAKENALGAKYLYDPEIVTADNVDVLKKAFEQPVYIPVPGLGKTVSPNAVFELPKSNVYSSSLEYTEVLKNITIEDTSLDQRSMGVSEGPGLTRTENERVQTNANIKLLLGANFDIEAEKEFYRTLWYREYVENKKYVKSKFIELTNGVQVIPMFLDAKDFLTKSDPRMKAVSTIDAEEKKERKRLSFMAVFNTLYQGATSEFGRKKLMKVMAELHDVDKDITNAVYGESMDEIQAKADLNLINKGIVPKVGSIDEDHDVFIDIYNSSPNTETKLKAIILRQIAKEAKKQAEMVAQQNAVGQGQKGPMPSGVENQALAQASNKQGQNVTTLDEVA